MKVLPIHREHFFVALGGKNELTFPTKISFSKPRWIGHTGGAGVGVRGILLPDRIVS